MATAGKGTFRVIAGCAVVRTLDGSDRYLYKGARFDAAGAEAENVEHLLASGLIAKTEEKAAAAPEADEGPYKGVSVKDLKATIDERNTDRADDAKIVPAEPGNRPEVIAALIADDARQQ